MFWGLNLKPNRKYSQTASKSFHISQAALDAGGIAEGESNQIFITCDNQKFLICSLRKGREQTMLDLNFSEGEEICFQSIGSGNVSLTGYVILDDGMNFMNGDYDDDESDVEQTELQDLRNALNKKAKAKRNAIENTKESVEQQDDDEDEEDDSDFDANLLDEDDDDDDEEDEDEEEGSDEADEQDEDEEEESDEEVQQPKAKQPKLDKAQKQQNGATKENAVVPAKKGKKDKKGNKENQQQPQKGGERVLSGGVKVEDISVGNGPEAKTGKRVQVYYEGRLKSNNKVFDSLKSGSGFKFGLGRGEVIKGWDVGVAGMKVGGKRRITCPPHMAYGARGSPPVIPPNSTLVFEVELKSVN